jgi:hypothetical protein
LLWLVGVNVSPSIGVLGYCVKSVIITSPLLRLHLIMLTVGHSYPPYVLAQMFYVGGLVAACQALACRRGTYRRLSISYGGGVSPSRRPAQRSRAGAAVSASWLAAWLPAMALTGCLRASVA